LRASGGHSVACHFWEEIAPPPGIEVQAAANGRLVRLQAAFRGDGSSAALPSREGGASLEPSNEVEVS
jgi:hypothetical protein